MNIQESVDGQKSVFILIIISVFALVLIRTAWMSDDAYIAFRTVDNFIHGHGLTYNIGERVQAYTNPLWMFLVSAVYSVTREFYFSVTALSILLSLAAVYLLMSKIAVSLKGAFLVFIPLIFSKAFVDYSTSGLENPISYLLLAAYLLIYFGAFEPRRRLFVLSLIAALATLNRMDTILLYLPSLLFVALENKRWKSLAVMALGFLPFILWELFCLFYYGFPFPNTAYAKLRTGVGGAELAVQGVGYFLNSIDLDLITLLAIAVGAGTALFIKPRRFFPLVLGILFYLGYIGKIGGDFMSGRFFAAPVFLAVALLSRFRWKSVSLYLGVLAVFAAIGFSTPDFPLKTGEAYSNMNFDDRGIASERGYYYHRTGLLRMNRSVVLPDVDRINGLRARARGGVLVSPSGMVETPRLAGEE